MSQDLRSYINLIREHKLLLDIKKEVDPLTNSQTIAGLLIAPAACQQDEGRNGNKNKNGFH